MSGIKKFVPTPIKHFLKGLAGITSVQSHASNLRRNSKTAISEQFENCLENLNQLNSEVSSLKRQLALLERRLQTPTDLYQSSPEYFAIRTMLCQYEHFSKPWYYRWHQEIYPGADMSASPRKLHRKLWEWYAITEALWERDFLAPGKQGLGFAVGTEPLSSLFAKYGVSVLATDLHTDNPEAEAWKNTNQHAESLESLWKEEIISRQLFTERVRFQNADMKNLTTINEKFDFVWSSCALEHLGNLEEGINFVVNSSKLLKPGGIGVHTTEFNVASNDETLTEGSNVIYRKRDIEELDCILRKQGMCLEEIDFRPGTSLDDRQYDVPPYYVSGKQHIKLLLDEHVATSLILIVYA